MPTTTIAGLNASGKICLSNLPEETVPCLGDGTEKAGAIVYIIAATGLVAKSNIGTTEIFEGILLKSYKTEVDTAIPANEQTHLVKPTSGHIYRVRLADPTATLQVGNALELGNGVLTKSATLDDKSVAYVHKLCVTGDTVAEVRWK